MRPAGFGVIRTFLLLRGVKLAQMTTPLQNGSRLCRLCQSQVRAGICSPGRRGMGEHPAASLLPLLLCLREAAWPIGVLAPLVGSSLQLLARQVLGTPLPALFDGFRMEYPPRTLGHHRCPPYPCGHRSPGKCLFRACPMYWGQGPVTSPRLKGCFSSLLGMLAARLLWSSAEPPKCGVGALDLDRTSCKCPTWVRSSTLGSRPPWGQAPCLSLVRGMICFCSGRENSGRWNLFHVSPLYIGPCPPLKFTLPLPPFPTKTVASSFSRGCPEGPGERRAEAPSSWKAPGEGTPSSLEPPLPSDRPPGHAAGLPFSSLAHPVAFVRVTVPPFSISSPPRASILGLGAWLLKSEICGCLPPPCQSSHAGKTVGLCV